MPHGIVLVTGPTGSGKTTTLYSALIEINRRDDEDHHDRRPGRISARRHQPDSGPSEDRPDVRRIRSAASCVTTRTSCSSAKSAIWKRPRTPSRPRSPATWCSARCTPTTPPAPTRGWSTWASSRSSWPARSKAVMAQRLVRRLCPHCKQKYEPTKDDLPADFPWDKNDGADLQGRRLPRLPQHGLSRAGWAFSS